MRRGVVVRPYAPGDEQGWLRCRVLSFLATAYFDDVATTKPVVVNRVELVADVDGVVAGLIDVSVDGDLATIDTVAVHPDHQRRAIGTELLVEATRRSIARGATRMDAWTRDDEATLAWYRKQGFAEGSHYLHIYADIYTDADEPDRAVQSNPGLAAIKVFLHGRMEDEERMRAAFRRVHVCRRFLREL